MAALAIGARDGGSRDWCSRRQRDKFLSLTCHDVSLKRSSDDEEFEIISLKRQEQSHYVIQNVDSSSKFSTIVVNTMLGLSEEYKHLVSRTHSDDADFDSVVQLVQQRYKMKKSDWKQGFVDIFIATEDICQQTRQDKRQRCRAWGKL
ncbi:hypothetical protein Bca4012_018381 [Brassica carinata]